MKKQNLTPWSSISDLMSALMMVFLFISVSYAYQVQQQTAQLELQKKKISKITTEYTDQREEIYKSLMTAFGPNLEDWKAVIDKDTLTLRFNDPALLFQPGSSNLTPRFNTILEEFWGRYVEILSSHSSSIREVKIEGHTSSEWADVTEDQSYFNNMELSQERTRSTLLRCYELTHKSKRQWVRSFVTANGMSFSRPVLDENNKEDVVKSRRVEFTVVVDSKSRLAKIVGEIND